MLKKEYLKLKNWVDEEGKEIVRKFLTKWENRIGDVNDAFYIFSRAFYDDALLNEFFSNNKSVSILFNRIDSKYQDFVDEVRDELTVMQIKAIILNFYRIEYVCNKNMISGLSIPEELNNLVYKLLDVKNSDKLFQPNSHKGEFLTDFLVNYPECSITIIDINTNNILALQLKLPIVNNDPNRVYIRQDDYIDIDLSTLVYNKIFSIPPMGMKYRDFVSKDLINLYNNNGFKKNNEWLDVLKIISNPKFEKALLIVHSGILFSEKDKKIRKYILDSGYVEGVIELAPKLFWETGISTNILLLSKNNNKVKMVDASELYAKDGNINKITEVYLNKIIEAYNNESKISKVVSLNKIEESNYSFIPRRYTNEDLNLKNYVYLRDVTEIKRGYANLKQAELNKRLTKEITSIKMLTASDINDDFCIEDLMSLGNINVKETIYCVKDGDIIFSRGGNYNSVLIRNSENYKILINGTLYILSCNKEKIDPYYLQMYLTSDHCLRQIESLNTGKSIQFMSINQLGELKIPKVSKEKEKELSQKYKIILDKKEIIRIQKKKIEEEISELIGEVL